MEDTCVELWGHGVSVGTMGRILWVRVTDVFLCLIIPQIFTECIIRVWYSARC